MAPNFLSNAGYRGIRESCGPWATGIDGSAAAARVTATDEDNPFDGKSPPFNSKSPKRLLEDQASEEVGAHLESRASNTNPRQLLQTKGQRLNYYDTMTEKR